MAPVALEGRFTLGGFRPDDDPEKSNNYITATRKFILFLTTTFVYSFPLIIFLSFLIILSWPLYVGQLQA
jgi:hypothetical protein